MSTDTLEPSGLLAGQQAAWDLEDAAARLRRLHELRDLVRVAQEKEDGARAVFLTAREDRKLAQLRLSEWIDTDSRPLPLFDRPTVPSPVTAAHADAPSLRLDRVRLDMVQPPLDDALVELFSLGLRTVGSLVDLAQKSRLPLQEALLRIDGQRLSRSACLRIQEVVAGWLSANPPPAPSCVRRCRECGCVEDECAGCILTTGAPCTWMEVPDGDGDLCSVCALIRPEPATAAPLPKPPLEVLELGLRTLDLPPRWLNRLEDAGYRTVGQLWKAGQGEQSLTDVLLAVKGLNKEAAGTITHTVLLALQASPTSAPAPAPPDAALEDLDRAYVGFVLAPGGRLRKSPEIVKTVYLLGLPGGRLDGRQWVCVRKAGLGAARRWFLLPLYPRDEYAERFGRSARGLNNVLYQCEAHAAPNDEDFAGITVQGDGGRHFLIGPIAELLVLPAVDPAAPAPAPQAGGQVPGTDPVDPAVALAASEGVRSMRVEGARYEYHVAHLPDGQWAVCWLVAYAYGNCLEHARDWTRCLTREGCLELFLADARKFFSVDALDRAEAHIDQYEAMWRIWKYIDPDRPFREPLPKPEEALKPSPKKGGRKK